MSSTVAPSASVILFRGLIIAHVVTAFLSVAIDHRFPGLVPLALLRTLNELPKPEIEMALSLNLLGFLGLALKLAATAGLYLFKPWSRGFAVSMTLLSVISYLLFGVQVKSGWALMLFQLSSVLWGAVLAISYVSSLSRRFAFDYVERPDDIV
jgi:hypothetical protein